MKKPKLQRITFRPEWHAVIAEMPDNLQGQAYRAIFDLLSDDSPLTDPTLSYYLSEIVNQIAEMKAEAARKAEIRRQRRIERQVRKQREELIRREEERLRQQEETARLNALFSAEICLGVKGADVYEMIFKKVVTEHPQFTLKQIEEVALQAIDELNEMIMEKTQSHAAFIRTFAISRTVALLHRQARNPQTQMQ